MAKVSRFGGKQNVICRVKTASLEPTSMKVAVIRRAHFNAAHRLHNPAWTDERNRTVFGLCNNANYHGHNYELEVKVTGEVLARRT